MDASGKKESILQMPNFWNNVHSFDAAFHLTDKISFFLSFFLKNSR